MCFKLPKILEGMLWVAGLGWWRQTDWACLGKWQNSQGQEKGLDLGAPSWLAWPISVPVNDRGWQKEDEEEAQAWANHFVCPQQTPHWLLL